MQGASGAQIFVYATNISGVIGAPACAIFILAVFWKRCNEKGAFWGMIIALLWGIVKFVMDLVYPAPGCGEPDNRPPFVSEWHIYYHSASQILMAFILAALISWATERPSQQQVNLTMPSYIYICYSEYISVNSVNISIG